MTFLKGLVVLSVVFSNLAMASDSFQKITCRAERESGVVEHLSVSFVNDGKYDLFWGESYISSLLDGDDFYYKNEIKGASCSAIQFQNTIKIKCGDQNIFEFQVEPGTGLASAVSTFKSNERIVSAVFGPRTCVLE